MNYVWLTLNWITAILFLALAIFFVSWASLASVPLLFIAVLFAPPVRPLIERICRGPIQAKSKAKLTVFFAVAFGFALLVHTFQEAGRRFAAKDAQEKAQVEALRQKQIADFQANRESLVAGLKKAMEEKRFEELLASAGRYAEMNDAELRKLISEAKQKLQEKRALEAQEKKKQQDATRAKEILAEIPKIPAQDHKRNFELYSELAKLTPEDAAVQKKLAVYRKKYQEQKEKERIVAEKAAKEVADQAAIKKRVDDQFSVWDGSHRNLEKYIKRSMNNPDSYKHIETTFKLLGDHLLIHTEFRGTNAFGGLVKNSVWANVDLDGNVVEILKSGP